VGVSKKIIQNQEGHRMPKYHISRCYRGPSRECLHLILA
jgi:hypothetical protein